MDISQLKRSPEKVHACLTEVDGKIIALKQLKIYIPSRFAERNLAVIDLDIRILGIYAIVTEDGYYGVSIINAMVMIEPTAIIKLMIEGNEYYEFTFEPGSTVITSNELVREDTIVYHIYDEFIAKGHIPWYMGYEDMGKLFDSAQKFAGARVGKNHEVIELLTSIITRDSVDRTKYYRQVVTTPEDLKNKPPTFIPLRSVVYNATNTTNKLAGSYMSEGLVSALVSPSERTERIESILST